MATAPDRVGRYLVREVIGSGGFATVYRATDERLRTDVAVKVLADNHSIDPEVRARFIEEARRLRKVDSPSLVTLYELGETDRTQPFLVLEWADRGDLASRVEAARRQGLQVTRSDVLAVAGSVTAALTALHGNDLVHRDLAPRNLLLRSGAVIEGEPEPAGNVVGADERLMLADLGLSKDLAAASGLTVAAGTSGFAPPEQRGRAGPIDRRADIWAASAVIVWMLTGRSSEDQDDWRTAVERAGWPRSLVEVLERGLATVPENRPPDICSWRAVLARALAPEPAAPDRSAWPTTARRRWLGVAAAGLLAVGVTAGLVVGRTTSGGSTEPGVRTQALDGGGRRTTVEDGDIRVELEGPVELDIGSVEEVTGRVEGTDTWVWIAPDGSVHPDVVSLEIEPETAGRATVKLLAVGERGETVEAVHRVVVPPADGAER